MSAAGSIPRRPLGEVIVDFADGGSYNKAKLEAQVMAIEERRIAREQAAKDRVLAELAEREKQVTSAEQGELEKSKVVVDRKQVEQLSAELKVSPREAEQALKSANGDVEKAVMALIQPHA